MPFKRRYRSIKQLEEQVSKLSDAIAALQTSTDGAISRVTSDHDALTAQVATLQATVDAGGATPDELAALAALQAKLDALDPKNPATLAPTPAPSPAPAPAAGGTEAPK